MLENCVPVPRWSIQAIQETVTVTSTKDKAKTD